MAVNFPPETRQFNHDAQRLLQPDAPYARSLRVFIYQTLRQFSLEGYFTELDVFTEAYLRGIQYTCQGEQISWSHAWLRRTAYNIVREWKRDRVRYCSAAFDDLLEQGVVGYHEDKPSAAMRRDSFWIDAEVQKVLRAFQALEECDRTLIRWKIIEALSWQTIQQRLVAEGHPATSLATLRKRGQRALERLRQQYHQQE
jgi:DNA-directed RNA polymerase specialized sigma24 family protein